MSAPSPHQGRGWALVILAAIVVLLGFAVLMPVAEMFAAQDDETAQAQDDLAVYRARIASRPRLKATFEAVRRQEAEIGALLPGSNSALAAAGMQSVVKALIEQHGGQMRSAQTLKSTTPDGVEKIVVQYELSLPLGSLKAVTYALETQAPYLFVDDIDVRPELYGGVGAGAPGNVHVQWTVHGYRRLEAS